MIFFQFLLVFITLGYSQIITIVENINPSRSFTFHLNENKQLLSLPDADDATLIEKQNSSYCHLQQKYLQTETKSMKIIYDYDFKEEDFDPDTLMNFRSFIAMAQIKDGIIALTSDLLFYLFKFDYDIIYHKNSVQEFASMRWKADFQKLGMVVDSKSEFAQIVYCRQAEKALIIFSNKAIMFSVREMEINDEEVEVFHLGNWVSRLERGLTKEFDNFIFSAVGDDGIDIYRIAGDGVILIRNFNLYTFNLIEFNLKDFTLYQKNTKQFRIFFLDVNGRILIVDIRIDDDDVQFIIVSEISTKGSGIAVDSKNGEDVFAAYQDKHTYIAIQYYIPLLDITTPVLINEYRTHTQIKDIDVTDEFAILQGLNHHKVLFRRSSRSHSLILPVFNHLSLRDFEFFSISQNKSNGQLDEEDYLQDDFFFGITSNTIFLTKFSVKPISVNCLQHQDIDQSIQQYTLIYNVTQLTNSTIIQELIVSNKLNFTVQMTKTYLFQDQLSILYIAIGILIFLSVSVVTYWLHTYNKELKQLEDFVSKAQAKKNNPLDMVSSERKVIKNDPGSGEE